MASTPPTDRSTPTRTQHASPSRNLRHFVERGQWKGAAEYLYLLSGSCRRAWTAWDSRRRPSAASSRRT
ncbi:unnamed protein product [Urochloa humidicola]